jgi:primosomal protein N' (replication factor Y)
MAIWMRDQYFCTVYDAARAILPAGLWFSLKDCWRLADGVDREAAYAAAGKSAKAIHLVELLFANDRCAELRQIRSAFGVSDPNPAIRQLASQGILVQETSTARGVGDKTEQVASLAIPPEEAMALITPKRHRAPLQYAAVEQLCAIGRVSARELCYFTGASMTTLRSLAKQGILTLDKQEVFRRPPLPVTAQPQGVALNSEQQTAYLGLRELAEQNSPAGALLYGVTGSGKTQVYLKLIYDMLEKGKTALVLVPEIALTPQLMQVFASHFGQKVAILHSSLSAGERYDEWKRARSGKARVVIGTRSAIFAPLPDLGLIVLDEEQEPSYKSEQTPRYHARDVARYRCVKHSALLVLGSATPSVDTMYWAKTGKYHLFTLTHRYNEQSMPDVTIVDMKEELKSGNGGVLSQTLQEALSETACRGEQSILFINRRGANRMVSCGECGQVPTCPRCSAHLTFHSANRRLMCHYCGHSEPLPEACPACGGLLNFIGAGTQRVETELKERFPGMRVLRMDTDTVNATRTHETILTEFREKKIPVLVGTQMVAKGLDFENVTLVGVVAADQTLYVDDLRAAERTFSLLTQVVGRAGRGSKSGRALIQTYTPDNEVIRCAARQDYDSFYEEEIELRRTRGYPPFANLFVFTASGREEDGVLRTCLRLRQELTRTLDSPDYRSISYQLLGPAPATVVKVNERYRYRLILCAKNQKKLRDLIAHLLRQAQRDKVNRGTSVFVDVDPMD